MADEPIVEPVVPEVVIPEAIAEPEPTPEPHPLEPGGPRFAEVYGQMKDYRRETEMLRAEKAAWLQQQQQQRAQQSQSPVVYSPQQLQAAVDQGQITPMAAADILARQNAQYAATQTTIAAIQAQQLDAKLRSAGQEVTAYLDKAPALRDQSSADFGRVRDEAYRVSDDMGLPVTDLRVQRVALRAVYGPLERMAANTQAREQSRSSSLPHVESTMGSTPAVELKGGDPLKNVDPAYIQHWTRKGYTRAQMLEEAKYLPVGNYKRRGLLK